MPAAQRTIATIEAEIGLARILYLVAVTHSNAMAATEAAAYTAYLDALGETILAQSCVDRATADFRTLRDELTALRAR